jgi:hypothetical protein
MPKDFKLLKDIHPNTKNWIAKVFVAEKLPIKISVNSGTQYQKLVLVDSEVISYLSFTFF